MYRLSRAGEKLKKLALQKRDYRLRGNDVWRGEKESHEVSSFPRKRETEKNYFSCLSKSFLTLEFSGNLFLLSQKSASLKGSRLGSIISYSLLFLVKLC